MYREYSERRYSRVGTTRGGGATAWDILRVVECEQSCDELRGYEVLPTHIPRERCGFQFDALCGISGVKKSSNHSLTADNRGNVEATWRQWRG